jgi:hypothetical protein
MQHFSTGAISVAWALVDRPEDRRWNLHHVEKPVPDLNDPENFRGVGKGIRGIFLRRMGGGDRRKCAWPGLPREKQV